MATDTVNSREAKFLASQQARLSRLQDIQDHSNEGDNPNIQHERKEFWKIFKLECSSLHSRLSALAGQRDEIVEGGENDVDGLQGTPCISMSTGAQSTSTSSAMYVTAAQRNKALSQLQNIHFSIRALHHYALHHSTGHSDNNSDNHDKMFLPQHFLDKPMPELPMADLRLLNTEVQLLKNRAYNVQSVIMPKEKFRFKRYHKAMQEKKILESGLSPGIPLFDESDENDSSKRENDEIGERGASDEDITTAEIKRPKALTSFDGLTLSNEINCGIQVQANGNFITWDLEATGKDATLNKITHNDVSLEAKAFLIRDIDCCQVDVNGMYNSVHVINTKETTIRIQSPTYGPVHVTNCHNTTIQIPFSRQLRVHDCTNVSFIIHVASGPIIEGCKGMKFYQKDYSNVDSSSGSDLDFDPGMNLYADVKDFHWLKNNVKSPNFDVYTEDTSRMVEELAEFFRTKLVADVQSSGNPLIQEEIKSNQGADDDGESSEDEL